jgi:hypothetical protein
MLPSRLKSHIWAGSTRQTPKVRVLIEEGNDFLLTDGEGERACVNACVLVAGGHLINADILAEGARVSVFGTVDRIADARAGARSAHGRGALTLAVRSTDALPLLVRSLPPGQIGGESDASGG